MWIHGQKLLRLKHILLREFNTARYHNGAALNDALFYLHKNENHEHKISLKQNNVHFSKCLPIANWQLKAHVVTKSKYILPTWNTFQTRFIVSLPIIKFMQVKWRLLITVNKNEPLVDRSKCLKSHQRCSQRKNILKRSQSQPVGSKVALSYKIWTRIYNTNTF